jgi:LysR family transcriptional regulator, carnitine catabolism transcriptional activator
MAGDLEWHRPLHNLNLNRLLTFMAVAEMQSFRGAAERIHISQSALSVQVRQLEHDLGVPLFHRTTRQVTLTDEGKRLYAVASRLGRDLLDVTSDLKGEAALHRGQVAIAVLPSLASTLLPRIIVQFSVTHPGITLRLRDTDSHRCLDLIRNGDADVGILSQNEYLQDLSFEPLFADEFVSLIPEAFPTPHFGKAIRLDQLRDLPIVLNPRGVDLRETLERLFANEQIAPAPIQELINTHALVSLVRSGVGVTVLPWLALQGLDLRGCRLLRIAPKASREIGLVSVRSRSESPAIAALRRYLRQHASSLNDEMRKGVEMI